VVEEPAHAAAASSVVTAAAVVMAVETEGMTAVMAAEMAIAAAVVVRVSSKHFVLDPISLYRSSRYIGLGNRQERISIYLICRRDGFG
jgi:hypothetical protein